MALYKCSCGNVKRLQEYLVKVNRTRSCGCLQKEYRSISGGKNKTHGDSDSSEYKAWAGAKARCKSKSDKNYRNYGGRGIKFCERWSSYEVFLSDMGRKPSEKHSLDRINVNGDYSPDNCRWATVAEQNANRRVHMVYANEFQDMLAKLKRYEELYGPLSTS